MNCRIPHRISIALILASIAGSALPAHAVKEPDGTGAPANGMIEESAAGWTWSGMVPYSNPQLSGGGGRAGGPGTYGVYTFTGTGVRVIGLKSPTVTVDGHAHKAGKVRILIDGKEQEVVDIGNPEVVYNITLSEIKNLSDGNHVLQVEPVGGWAVIDGIKLGPKSGAGIVHSEHLVGYWPLDETSGQSAADKSGHNNTGYLQAGAAWGTGAITFPSPGGVEIPQPVVDTSQSFTVSAWVKLHSLSGYQTFVSIDGNKVSGFYLQLRDDNHQFGISMLQSDGATAAANAAANFAPQVGVWYNIVGAFDASAQVEAIFVDGVYSGSKPVTTAWRADGATVIGRGKFDGTLRDFTTAEIRNVRIYDAALTPTAIKAIYEKDREK